MSMKIQYIMKNCYHYAAKNDSIYCSAVELFDSHYGKSTHSVDFEETRQVPHSPES